MMANYISCLKGLCYLLLVFGLGTFGGNPLAFASTCWISTVYQGPHQAVIEYSFNGDGFEVTLTATLSSGGSIKIAKDHSGSGTFHHTNLTPGRLSPTDSPTLRAAPTDRWLFPTLHLGRPIYGDAISGIATGGTCHPRCRHPAFLLSDVRSRDLF